MTTAPETIYDPEDVLRLTRGAPMRLLTHSGLALETLRKQVEVLKTFAVQLGEYGDDWWEPLDFAYAYLRLQGMWNADLRDDLLLRSGKAEMQTLGALGAMLSPLAEDATALAEARKRGGDLWMLGLATARLDEAVPQAFAEHSALIDTIRAALAPIIPPQITLIRQDAAPVEELAALREAMKLAYKMRGADAAQALFSAAKADENTALGAYLRAKHTD